MKTLAIIALIAFQTLTAYAIPSFCGGSGTSSDPYQICTAQDLADLGDFVNAGASNALSTAGLYFLLMNDINLTSYISGTGNNGGKGWKPIGKQDNFAFQGYFNGGGHKIIGLWINRPNNEDVEGVGLFGYIMQAEISNLGVEINNTAGGVKGKSYVGGLAGGNDRSIISNVYVTGNIIGGNNSGGLVGTNYDGTISNCYATGDVSGFDYVGGLVGYNIKGTIRNSIAANNSISTRDNICRLACNRSDLGGTLSNNYANSAMTISVNGSIADADSYHYIDNDINGTGKSLSDLKSFAFYNTPANWYNNEAWDIDNAVNLAKIWRINDGTSLPFFQSQTDIPQPQVDIAKPVLAQTTFTYTGSPITVSLNPPSSSYTLSGDVTKTNAGTYTATVTLVDPTTSRWEDGTTIDLAFDWSITEDETPIFPNRENPLIGRIGVQTISNTIILSNLPTNTKIELYNLQGKHLHSSHSENSKILVISVQTKGIYIVKVGSQILRIAVR